MKLEPNCEGCIYLGLNHDPAKHCLRSSRIPIGGVDCSDLEEIQVLPVYTLAQLGFRSLEEELGL